MTVTESQQCLIGDLSYCNLLNKCMKCLHQVAVPEGIDIATYYYWRHGHSWSFPEGNDIAFLDDS